jgi:hypothetical protein
LTVRSPVDYTLSRSRDLEPEMSAGNHDPSAAIDSLRGSRRQDVVNVHC